MYVSYCIISIPMEIIKLSYSIYLNCLLVALIAMGLPIYTTIIFWEHLDKPPIWIVIGMIYLLFPFIFYIPGMIRKARNRIIVDTEGVIFEDISAIKLKWDNVETFQLKRLQSIRYLAIITKPNSSYANNYWINNRGTKIFNRFLIGKNGVLLALNAYSQRPEKILSILLEALKISVSLNTE